MKGITTIPVYTPGLDARAQTLAWLQDRHRDLKQTSLHGSLWEKTRNGLHAELLLVENELSRRAYLARVQRAVGPYTQVYLGLAGRGLAPEGRAAA